MASDTANYARSVLGQGLGMGWGDEAEAWLRSKAGQGSYEDLLSQINKEYSEFAQRSPVMAPVAEFAGGVLPLAASYLGTALTGGAAAPAAAATTARSVGALTNLARQIGSKVGAIPGAATVGAKVAPIAEGAATVGKNIVSNPYGRGAVIGGTTGAVSGAGSAEPDRRGEGAAYGTAVGTVVGGSIPAVLRGAGSGWDWVRERLLKSDKYLDDRAAKKIVDNMKNAGITPEQAAQKLAEDRAMGVPSMLVNVDKSLVNLGETVANKGGNAPGIMEKAIAEQREGARERVFGQVKKQYGTEGRFYEEEQNIIKDLRTKAKPYYDQAYSYGEVTDPKVLEFMRLPQFRQGLREAKELLAADGQKLPTVTLYNAEGKKMGERVAPTVEVLDQVKRGLDSLIEKETDALGKVSSLGRIYVKKKNEFLTALDNAVPEYGQARAIYKGDAEVRDALRSGMKDFGKLDHEEVQMLMNKMGDAEKDAYTTGAVRNLYSTVMNPSQNINSAQRLIGSPEMRAKLLALSEGNTAKFNLFKTALERESELFHEANKMISNSATARRTAGAKAFDEGENIGSTIADAVTGGVKNSLTQMAGNAIRSGGISNEVAERVAKMLASKEPKEIAAAVKVLEEYGAKATKAAEGASARETASVVAGATTAQPAPRDRSSVGDIDMSLEEDLLNRAYKNGPDIDEVLAQEKAKSDRAEELKTARKKQPTESGE